MKGNTASEGDVINYDRVFANSLNTLRSGSFHERKIVIMSFCEAEDDDKATLILTMKLKLLYSMVVVELEINFHV